MTDIIKNLPHSPGVYIFRNKSNRVIYVGKAVDLKARVSSYFAKNDLLDVKTKALVSKIIKIEHIVVNNEIEALLLESELIKRYKPPYNINLKDDKFYKYIVIEKNKLGDKIGTSRTQKTLSVEYFGPYPESSSISIILKTLRKIFPYRDCSNAKYARYQKLEKPCLYGHIGICPAPCQSEKGVVTNNQNVKKIKEYLRGDRKRVFQNIFKEMKNASKSLDFEKAAYLRDQVSSYNYLTQEIRNIKDYIASPNLIETTDIKSVKNLILELKKISNFQFDENNKNPFRIETYDISNIHGKNAVGAMVVTTNGTMDKSEYRKFKIKTKDTPDDFEMMKEMLSRRFENNWALPNLIVIDGGKGQLSSALEVLNAKGINIPIIGLAKREEEIVLRKDRIFEVVKLQKSSPALTLLRKGRDEAHRFGISYYRKLHRKKLYE
ncbi:hypothetical protein CO178_00385 [candidate division WWE3 bacterium CG_4_9_14_3_um_filter_34_6]|uniref:Excinuclease ABC subunit C n=1 Tax=candidate division WWE3 bacterium CG_4_9_14_3_um_filter_34_6 TaxID=1975079 RepID=A0A2M7X593_UNCKA|nr:MAG: hypothetical protein CO178_00385 [candidate division WWE3 bacterium CG_4_9_14_3_um_filter_34_6]